VGGVSWEGLEILANAWHGLEPWNRFFRTDFLDQHLMRGVERPASAVMLTAEERSLGSCRRTTMARQRK
jgi:hypothetical protein